MKELTQSQVKAFKNNLIKLRDGLIKKKQLNNRIIKNIDNYNRKDKFCGIKDIRHLFNNDEDEFAYEDIKYLFDEEDVLICEKESPFKSTIADIRRYLSKMCDKLIKNGLKYAEEMKKLTES